MRKGLLIMITRTTAKQATKFACRGNFFCFESINTLMKQCFIIIKVCRADFYFPTVAFPAFAFSCTKS